MRLALAQCPSPGGDIPAALAAVDRTLAVAAAAGADLAVMPELFLPGYNAAPMTADPAWPDRLAGIARAHGVALAIGLAEEAGGALRNTARVFGADGAMLARYDKAQLFGERERALFDPGVGTVTCTVAGRRVGVLICYDVEFPERVRAHARAGVEVLVVPTANPEPFDTVSRYLVPARAMENAMTVAYANLSGTEGGLTYAGRSVIAGPDGVPLAEAGTGPALLVADLPTAGLRPLSTQLEDLRP